MITSWAEYTRQRQRMTVSDRELQDRVTRLNLSHVPIRVSRLIGVGPDSIPDEDRTPKGRDS